jgi:hypothetical protein
LMAVEFRNWMEHGLGVNLPTIEIMRGPSVERLVLRLQEVISHAL